MPPRNTKYRKPSKKQVPNRQKKARGKKKAKNTADAFCIWDTNSIDCGGKWSWNTINPKTWWAHICPAREKFKSMKWSEIIGDRHHPIDVCNIITEAQKRLEEIDQHDTDVLYSFAIGGLPRIWGISK